METRKGENPWHNNVEFGDVLGFYLLDIIKGKVEEDESLKEKLDLASADIIKATDQHSLADFLKKWATNNNINIDRAAVVRIVENNFLELKNKFKL